MAVANVLIKRLLRSFFLSLSSLHHDVHQFFFFRFKKKKEKKLVFIDYYANTQLACPYVVSLSL